MYFLFFLPINLNFQLLLLPFDYSYVFEEFSSNLFNSKSSSLVSSLYFPVGTSNLIFIILTRFNDLTLYPKALGYKVRSLKRVRIMNIKLDVPTGKYRELTKEELLELNRLLENSSKTYE